MPISRDSAHCTMSLVAHVVVDSRTREGGSSFRSSAFVLAVSWIAV